MSQSPPPLGMACTVELYSLCFSFVEALVPTISGTWYEHMFHTIFSVPSGEAEIFPVLPWLIRSWFIFPRVWFVRKHLRQFGILQYFCLFLFNSGHRDQIACSLLGGFSNPRTAATQSIDSGLCSMLSKLPSFPFIRTRPAPFLPTWAACPAFCFPSLLPLRVCPRFWTGRRFRLRLLRLCFLPVNSRLFPPP